MSYVSKIFTVTLLGLAFLLTGCDPSGLSGADQILKETKPGTIENSSQLNEAATEYEIVDLGTLGGYTIPNEINNTGKVVGLGINALNEIRAFAWTDTEGFLELNSLGGTYSSAQAINNVGDIVGTSTFANSNGEVKPSMWNENGDIEYLGSLGGSKGVAHDINDDGQVVGYNETSSGYNHAFIWDEASGMRDLGTLGGESSYAQGINSAGQVVGSSETSSGESHAFIWDEAGGMRSLGTLGGESSNATGINDAGQVVGSSETLSGESHAFIWDEAGGMRNLGTLGGIRSVALGINNAGQVVGSSQTSSGEYHAYIWDDSVGMRDLGTLGGVNSGAYNINNVGQIVGNSTTSSGEDHVTLWNPIQNSDVTPPEISFEKVSTTLWPPNHKMRLVLSDISANDNIDENPTLTVSVESNERLNGLGDGNTDEDWQIFQSEDGSYDVYLRAERSGNGSGRTYTVTMTAEDASGNVAEEIVDIQVARDMGKSLK